MFYLGLPHFILQANDEQLGGGLGMRLNQMECGRSKVNRCSVETCMVLGKDCYGFESCSQGDVSGQFY